jgi:hypothetical protein
MANDQLILGGIVFSDWSTPSKMPFGGKQALAVHKLSGGRRVIDTLGPDEMDIQWSGTFWGQTAYEDSLALNALRISGAQVGLSFAGQFYMVVVSDVHIDIERLPMYATYSVSCVVSQNVMAGALGSVIASADSLVSADIATALSFAGL